MIDIIILFIYKILMYFLMDKNKESGILLKDL